MESFWMKVTGATLRQGDYLYDCPVPEVAEFPTESGEQSFPVEIRNLIELTQSCDLENGKATFAAS